MAIVTVRSRAGRAFTTDVEGERHSFVADEPVSFGGDDEGPTPYDLLLAAIGSCTAMTVNSYARRKGWPLTGMTIRLGHDRVYAEDCERCEQPGVRIDRITRQIAFEGDLDDGQRARLMEIAGKCPVHRTLAGEVRIVDVSGDS